MALAFSFDLVAGISLPNEAGLEVRIDKALENVFQTYDEMGISFDEQGLQDVIAGLLPSLLGSGDPIIIELNEEALGVPLVPKVLSLHPLDTTNRLLGVFLKLCTDSTADEEICEAPVVADEQATKFALRPDEGRRLVYLDTLGLDADISHASIQMPGFKLRHAFRKLPSGWAASLPHTALVGTHHGQLEVGLTNRTITRQLTSFDVRPSRIETKPVPFANLEIDRRHANQGPEVVIEHQKMQDAARGPCIAAGILTFALARRRLFRR